MTRAFLGVAATLGLVACEDPSPAAHRACARLGLVARCVSGPDLEDGTCPFRCVEAALECDGGCPDAALDGGVAWNFGVDADLQLPGPQPTRVRR